MSAPSLAQTAVVLTTAIHPCLRPDYRMAPHQAAEICRTVAHLQASTGFPGVTWSILPGCHTNRDLRNLCDWRNGFDVRLPRHATDFFRQMGLMLSLCSRRWRFSCETQGDSSAEWWTTLPPRPPFFIHTRSCVLHLESSGKCGRGLATYFVGVGGVSFALFTVQGDRLRRVAHGKHGSRHRNRQLLGAR